MFNNDGGWCWFQDERVIVHRDKLIIGTVATGGDRAGNIEATVYDLATGTSSIQVLHRPYVKYASNGRDTVHIAYTEGHPRYYDNSVYHVIYRDGQLRRSDGTPIRALSEGLKSPDEGTLVFKGDPNNVAWTSDLHIDRRGRPYMAVSVQKDSAGLPRRQGGEDHRYRFARWIGKTWECHEIAYAGTKLYPGEDDYTGNIALDPHDPDIVHISTNADPITGKRLAHWEIFRGNARGPGRWTWTPITSNSDVDNIRPIVPIWPGKKHALLWLRGKMRAYTDYTFEVVGFITDRQ